MVFGRGPFGTIARSMPQPPDCQIRRERKGAHRCHIENCCGQTVARLPAVPVELSRTGADSEQYVRQTRDALYEAYYQRTLDQKAANRFADNTMQKLGLILVP